MTTQTLEPSPLRQRHIGQLDVRTLNETTRTIDIACSSEYPVASWIGNEILLHGAENVRLDRLKNKASLLFNHQYNALIGVVENVRLDADKVLRATVRFAKDAESETRWQQVLDGILHQVSIGYRVYAETQSAEGNTLCTDWEPHEISLVSVAADPTVGKGRAIDMVKDLETNDYSVSETRDDAEKEHPPMTPTLTPEMAQAEQQRALDELQTRNLTMIDLGQKHNALADATRFMKEGKSVADLQSFILERNASSNVTLDHTVATAPPAQVKNQFRNMGEQLQAIARHHRGLGMDERLRAIQGANTVTGEDGGFLLQPEFAQGIMKNIYETGQIISRCATIPLSAGKNSLVENRGDNFDRSTRPFSGMSVEWTEEGGVINKSKPNLIRLETRASKITGLFYVTEETLQDASALSAFAQDEMSSALEFAIEEAVLRGNGVGKPLGILNAGTKATVTIAKESGQAAGTVVLDNISKMYAAAYKQGASNMVWLANDELFVDLLKLQLGNQPVFMPAGGISGSPFATIFNTPVIFTDQASAKGAKGDLMLLNLSQYRLAMKEQAQMSESMHVEFLSDQQVFKIRSRSGGQSLWPDSIKPRNATSGFRMSPFVVLEARA
jgi:HK97 family phage major capsid protein/HK97 family phage prohead protease